MKKILITGGAGYIGSHTAVVMVEAGLTPIILDDLSNSSESVIDRLEEIMGYKPIFYKGDCNDSSILNQIGKEHQLAGVIHFAAYKAVGESTQEPLKYYQNNLGSLMVLLDFMKREGIQDLVFSSSCTVYGQPDVLPVTETTPRKDAESPYGNTKKVCEDILVDYVKSKAGVRVISLRYFNPVGAHPSAKIGELPNGVPNNLVPFVTQTAAGLRNKLTVFGNDYDTSDGSCVRDFIHVMDLADAHVKALNYLGEQDANFYDVFNVGTGHGNTVLEVVETFEKVNQITLNYEIGPKRPGDVVKIWADTKKINQILGWFPKYSLEDSLRDSWNWQKTLN
ncbi:MAG TPA: UDP-glucose 4-epimerase GalE [Algoriphagus sp.]|jgi:UDP-glucose 4-epimerase|uniref:UDP-glucose 4-epimerase GalE n=1 Tax=unclassified Algoriphagus TaxID=2641541 RepID=UPI000C5B6AB6|nr:MULTISPECIES: UDP-glucose 4-epimerase GalE [unclassified Algoriphagus]MAL15545.1 UDP-glucose 4-epimerase GalE [Algoriphagus sp.]MAN87945.1 UDP-glucose 4-epimerase GalE [Algoriphagus sp.]HAS59003.1 UDP-glucose 4-epimerase GalE [Algoriphagus sp.]HCD86849.1 UDP-glucose 4-epimerase GalE [Algoriphagus sp.]HCH43082.1 UDP-glucose 4-epimerase GalE [Algoriphagus sp.]|tara:strand:+ start:61 stop:1071 length:1011 start_codon:yes stop_codon:yes gene_type:complete